MRNLALLFAFALTTVAVGAGPTADTDLEQLAEWMTGSFSSQAQSLADLDPTDLSERQGCTIFMQRRADGAFEGSTLGRLCPSTLRGAAWASSEVVITADSLASWDRGWDDSGAQIWGAEKAGYRFDRIEAPSDGARD